MYTLETTNVDAALVALSRDLLELGRKRGSRNGETLELAPVAITLTNPLQREILNPTRRANLAAQIAETMWVLAGRDDVDFLAHYIPRARDFSDDGKVWRAAYGKRLRSWPLRDGSGDVKDQLAWVAEHLSQYPDSRRAVVSIWDPVRDQPEGNGLKDIPCNNWLQFLIRDGKLDLHVALRSNDLVWGWSGINQFEWSVLLEVMAWLVGTGVGSLHFSTTSLHAYQHHYTRLGELSYEPVQMGQETGMRFHPNHRLGTVQQRLIELDTLLDEWFAIEEVLRRGENYPLEFFPDPMLREWLAIIDCYWNGREGADPRHTVSDRMLRAWRVSYKRSPKPSVEPVEPVEPVERDPFAMYVDELHLKKDAAYGDSWCRRGEMLGIMANIARKVDRLGKTDDLETAADTAIDLLVYLLKYRGWLDGVSHSVEYVSARLDGLAEKDRDTITIYPTRTPDLEGDLRRLFDENLIPVVEGQLELKARAQIVDAMTRVAYALARPLWEAEQGGSGTDEYQGADHD